ncbi:hypothetical protein [Candidatus Methylomirabilis sp.]|nr:hypothetical protein [Candidatus Methylomirabilis sp.]
MDDFVRWFDEIDLTDISLVGGKNVSLGEMHQNLEVDGAIDCPVMV